MGNTLPKFKHEDNPASFHEKLSTRIMTYLYLLVFNIKLLLVPSTLCYDWQVGSIPLVETLFDHRNLETLLFMLTAATLMCTLTYRHTMVRAVFFFFLMNVVFLNTTEEVNRSNAVCFNNLQTY